MFRPTNKKDALDTVDVLPALARIVTDDIAQLIKCVKREGGGSGAREGAEGRQEDGAPKACGYEAKEEASATRPSQERRVNGQSA